MVGAIWLVFLAFPVTLLFLQQPSTAARATGLALIAAFAVAYAIGFVMVSRCDDVWRGSPWLLAGLTGLVLALVPLIGIDVLGMVPFLVSYAIWGLPWPRGAWVAAGLVAAGLVALVVTGAADRWFYALLMVMVCGFGVMMRSMEKYSDRQAELNEVMAVVSERERVARDVHDVLGHSLTAISVKAELASRLVEADPARAADELTQVQTLARHALAEVRSTVSGLRATRIDDELETARASLAAAGIGADLPADSDVVEISNRIVLAWALREAVTNVIRHSGARHCVVTLGPDSLVVTDDGVGGTGVEGNGLRGLRERVAASGGTVTLGPGPDGRGHELRVQL